MRLENGCFDVPAGKIAAVVTHLRMLTPPTPRPARHDNRWSVRRVSRPSTAWYRALYRQVGENWLWFSRLTLATSALEMILDHPRVEVYSLMHGDSDDALMELDFRVAGQCELALFGVAPALIGQGAGRLLMHHAIERAWDKPIGCFWVHTCTFDHPHALNFYLRSGFRPFKRQIEIADDPRLHAVFPAAAAPHVPII
jgi:GNAT superfamily N-acetyltransferase